MFRHGSPRMRSDDPRRVDRLRPLIGTFVRGRIACQDYEINVGVLMRSSARPRPDEGQSEYVRPMFRPPFQAYKDALDFVPTALGGHGEGSVMLGQAATRTARALGGLVVSNGETKRFVDVHRCELIEEVCEFVNRPLLRPSPAATHVLKQRVARFHG